MPDGGLQPYPAYIPGCGISAFQAVTRRPDKRSAIRHFAVVQMPDGGLQPYPAYIPGCGISAFQAVTRRPDKRSAIRHFSRVQMPDGGFQPYPAYDLSGDNKSLVVVDKRLLFCGREDGTKIHLGA